VKKGVPYKCQPTAQEPAGRQRYNGKGEPERQHLRHKAARLAQMTRVPAMRRRAKAAATNATAKETAHSARCEAPRRRNFNRQRRRLKLTLSPFAYNTISNFNRRITTVFLSSAVVDDVFSGCCGTRIRITSPNRSKERAAY